MLISRPLLGRFVTMPSSDKNNMDRLPEELVIRIFHFLSVGDLVNIQLVSSRYLTLARDNTIWKEECFTHSRSEARRRRQHQLDIQDARLAELRYALHALPGVNREPAPRVSEEAEEEKIQRHRARVNWDPSYPGEKLNFYEEYISRHAPIQISWLNVPKTPHKETLEATGIGILRGQHAISPLEDGSICIWDISARSTSNPTGGSGHLLAQSAPGLLSNHPPSKSHAPIPSPGATESISISSSSQTGYFALGTHLHSIDLQTLQIASKKIFPWPITALSPHSAEIPLTVGTNHTIHLYDPRDPTFSPGSQQPGGGSEIIAGSAYSHATLPQPGPLSILHDIRGESIWVAGRFTSLLHYDRRFFPRLLGSTFSGARIASLASIPYPFVPRHIDLVRNPATSISAYQTAKAGDGMTLLAAAEYKGKGSLELYATDGSKGYYRNRQTASASKLLAVAPHGGKVVCSDGDGNLRWFERNGGDHIRTFNLQDEAPKVEAAAEESGIWHSSSNAAMGQGDIVQKILPIDSVSSICGDEGRPDIHSQDLMLWTGDGRLGVLGFGHSGPLEEARGEEVGEGGLSTVERARADAERSYEGAMRRALQRNADEVRFVRGLGMGYER